MTIDEYLDSIGITPGPWERNGDEVVADIGLSSDESDICYMNCEAIVSPWDRSEVAWEHNARLIAQSREMLKALIEEQFFHMDYEQYIGDEDKDMSLDNGRLGWRGRRIIKSATGKTWAEIKEALND